MIANVYKTKAEPNYIPANSSRWIDDDLLRHRCKEPEKKGIAAVVPDQITMTIPSKWAIILLESKQPYPHNDDDDENLVNWQQRGEETG